VKDRLRSFDCSIGRSIGFLDSAESATPSPLAPYHLYHTSPKFRRVLSAADHSTNSSEDVATSGPYRAATGSKNAGTAGASFFSSRQNCLRILRSFRQLKKGRDGKFTRTKQFCFTLGASQLADSRAGSIYRIRRDEKISMGARTESRG
jgi:hypothetical protein